MSTRLESLKTKFNNGNAFWVAFCSEGLPPLPRPFGFMKGGIVFIDGCEFVLHRSDLILTSVSRCQILESEVNCLVQASRI